MNSADGLDSGKRVIVFQAVYLNQSIKQIGNSISGMRDQPQKMRYFFVLALFFSSITAWGQNHENAEGKSNFPQGSAQSKTAENTSNAYASATFGDGLAYSADITGDKSMQWRAFEVRFGREISVPAFIGNKFSSKDEKFRVDFIHYNEGHPDNNHRDGFAVQMVYRKPLNPKLSLELGLGPYYSMNTTKIFGVEYDDAKLGVLLSMAALVDLDRFSPGLHMRYALNHVTMPGAHSSVALLVGVGKYFNQVPARVYTGSSRSPVWLGVATGPSKTNHGDTEGSLGFAAEAKIYHGSHWATSVSAHIEGNDDIRVDRQGVALQGWFVQPLSDKWAVSAGIGPYAAVNKHGSDHVELHALITFQVERFIARNWKGFASFSRVITFAEKNDRDLFRIGVMRQFGQ